MIEIIYIVKSIKTTSSCIKVNVSPVQLNPFPENPSMQVQVYDPLASMQVALSWQPSSSSQLMISAKTDFHNLSMAKTPSTVEYDK